MGYTNIGLVKHAKNLLAMNTKYMWGGIARPITKQYIQALAKQYPSQYSSSRVATLNRCVGKDYIGVDCVGLIKSYYWSGNDEGGLGSPKYSASTDVNTDGMYYAAKIKGDISTLPEKQGIVLLCRTHPHVGVYVGDGEVIESTLSSRGDGVVKTKLSDFKWEYWLECPYITYIDTPTAKTYSEKDGKRTDFEACSSWEINGIYKSLSVPAVREEMSKNSNIIKRCVEGNYYPMDRYIETASGVMWYRHSSGNNLYSMKKDIVELFERVGTYKRFKSNATVKIRVAPTIKAALLGKIYDGDIIYAFSTSPTKADGYNWQKVIYNGKIAYCSTRFLEEM